MTDLAFEALCRVCNIDWQGLITNDERGRVNAALKQLRDLYGDIETLPMMIHERASAWAVVYPEINLTPQSLTGHWSSILAAADAKREGDKQKATEARRVTNAHARNGCHVCGDDHFVTVGYDSNGTELTAPCPECNMSSDPSYWVQRRRVQVMDPAKTRELMDG